MVINGSTKRYCNSYKIAGILVYIPVACSELMDSNSSYAVRLIEVG